MAEDTAYCSTCEGTQQVTTTKPCRPPLCLGCGEHISG